MANKTEWRNKNIGYDGGQHNVFAPLLFRGLAISLKPILSDLSSRGFIRSWGMPRFSSTQGLLSVIVLLNHQSAC